MMILLRMSDCRKTQTRRTSRFCMNLSLMFSHEEMQFEMYRCTNSVGRSTAVVSLLTTSIECRLMSMLTSTCGAPRTVIFGARGRRALARASRQRRAHREVISDLR